MPTAGQTVARRDAGFPRPGSRLGCRAYARLIACCCCLLLDLRDSNLDRRRPCSCLLRRDVYALVLRVALGSLHECHGQRPWPVLRLDGGSAATIVRVWMPTPFSVMPSAAFVLNGEWVLLDTPATASARLMSGCLLVPVGTLVRLRLSGSIPVAIAPCGNRPAAAKQKEIARRPSMPARRIESAHAILWSSARLRRPCGPRLFGRVVVLLVDCFF